MSFMIDGTKRLAFRIHLRREMNIARRKKDNETAKAISAVLADQDYFEAAYQACCEKLADMGDDTQRRPLMDLLQFLVDNREAILDIILMILPLIIAGMPLTESEEQEILKAITPDEQP